MERGYYNTIVDHNEDTLMMLIDYAQGGIELPNVLEAISMKQMSDLEVRQLTIEIRMKKDLMNREALALADFSENFNKRYATDNNKCFEVAERLFGKIRSTIAGYKKVVKTFCPRSGHKKKSSTFVRPSAFIHSVIFNRHWYGDFFPELYPDAAYPLYLELTDFFALATVTLALCHRVIMEEDRIRKNYFLLKRIYDDSCRELMSSSRLLTVKVTESELMERRKNAKSLQEFIQENFHKFTRAELAQFVVLEAIRQGNSHGLTEEETLIWGENYEKALAFRDVVSRLDTLGLMTKKTNKVGKAGQYDTVELVYMLKWGCVEKSKEKRLYKYIEDNYKGKYALPGWGAIHKKRKEFQGISDEEMRQNFESHLLRSTPHVAPMSIMTDTKSVS